MLRDLVVNKFVGELASNSPAPGGGSVSALAASLGGALNAMVFNLTVGKKVFNEYDEATKQLIVDSLRSVELEKDSFLELMDKDTEEFMNLMSAFKLPKDTEEEKALRSKKIEEGYRRAISVPLEVADKSFKLYESILIAAKLGNKNAVSDAGVAALLVQAAIEGAVLNVRINLSSISDDQYKEELTSHCTEVVKAGAEKRDQILEIVYSKI